MPKLTEQQQLELERRNAEIAERYKTLVENQPLATANRIICYLASEYGLTPQRLAGILREMGFQTAATKTCEL